MEAQAAAVVLLLFEGRIVVVFIPESTPVGDFRRDSGDGS